MSGFLYAVRLSDGSDAGEVELAQPAQVGDEIRLSGNRRARVVSVVPRERIEEHVSRPMYGLLAVDLAE